MKRLNKFFSAVLCTMVLMGLSTSAYAKTILYVPQDDRPVDYAYTVKTAEDAGYTVLTPPRQYLSGSNFHGSPDELMNWVETHASEAAALLTLVSIISI